MAGAMPNDDPDKLNNRPIIAVLAQHHKQLPANKSYISASVVKFLEASGARVVPVPRSMKPEDMAEMFQYVNGALFPGGDEYVDDAEVFFKLAIEANNRGDHFPIFGICYGFQVFHMIVAGIPLSFLDKSDTGDVAMPLKMNGDVATNSKLLKGSLSNGIYDTLTNENVTYNYHYDCVTSEMYEEYPELENFFDVISWNSDGHGKRFISTVEAKEYPFYGVQWHPEKCNFEFSPTLKNLPHGHKAVITSQYFGNFFVDESRKNSHRFSSNEMEEKALIYNYKTVHSRKEFSTDSFLGLGQIEQIYVFE